MLAFVEPAGILSPNAFQAVFQAAPTALALVRAGAAAPTVAAANEAFLQLMMRGRPVAGGLAIDRVFRAAAGARVRDAVEACLTDREPVKLRVAHAAAGKVVRLEVEVRAIDLDGGAWVILAVSASEARPPLAERGEAEVLAELGALSRGLVYIHDLRRGRVRYGRHPLITRLGLPGAPLPIDEVRQRVHSGDRGRFEAYLADLAALPDGRGAKTTFRIWGARTEWVWVEVRSRVFSRDREGAVRRLIAVATDVTEAHLHAAAMASAADSLAHAEVNERRRIGRELHDSMSQLLVAARLDLAAVERRSFLTPDALAALREARQSIAGAQSAIRSFSYLLHPPTLQTQGLARCLRAFGSGFAHRTDLAITVKVGSNVPRLPDHLEVALYRIAQEALMNVYRHARATNAFVRLRHVDGRILLEIEDDGVGLRAPLDRTRGVGIAGMQARMTQIGGTLSFDTERQGLLVRAAAPVAPRPDA